MIAQNPRLDREKIQKDSYLDQARELSKSKLASLSTEEKLRIISFLKKQIQNPAYEIPAEIFNNNSLSSLEAIIKYLVEIQNLGFTKISNLINRSDKTIWTTYKNAQKKMPKKFKTKKSSFFIPISILENRKLSVLENIVSFLKIKYSLAFSEIALLLNRKYSTIATVYHRSIRKNQNEK